MMKNSWLNFWKLIKNKLKITILGAGSNTLIRDKGIRGVVIKLGKNFSEIKLIEKNILKVGASALDKKISNFAKENGIGDLEFLSCIPGSIGGSVMMNSGCYGGDISKVLVSINVIDMEKCIEKEIKRDEIEFFYRGNNLSNNLIITAATLKGTTMNTYDIEKKQKEFIEKRNYLSPVKLKLVEVHLKILVKKKKLGN